MRIAFFFFFFLVEDCENPAALLLGSWKKKNFTYQEKKSLKVEPLMNSYVVTFDIRSLLSLGHNVVRGAMNNICWCPFYADIKVKRETSKTSGLIKD